MCYSAREIHITRITSFLRELYENGRIVRAIERGRRVLPPKLSKLIAITRANIRPDVSYMLFVSSEEDSSAKKSAFRFIRFVIRMYILLSGFLLGGFFRLLKHRVKFQRRATKIGSISVTVISESSIKADGLDWKIAGKCGLCARARARLV